MSLALFSVFIHTCQVRHVLTPMVMSSDRSWAKILDPGRVGSAIFVLGLGFENFPKNLKFINFFPLDQNKSLLVGSKSTRGGLLFTAGQKICLVRIRAHL